MRVLALLALEPDIEPRDAARALAVHPASLHHTLQQLILAGSVSQEPHPADGRRRLLRLTERGREEYALLRRPVEEDLSSLTEHLTEPEQRGLARLLGQLRQRLALAEDGLDKPVIFCDWCAERIRKASKAICIWKIPGEPEPSLIVFLHKGACDRSYVAAHGGKQA